MKSINDLKIDKREMPIKVVQFGEGNFLRAFADYMIDILNEKTDLNGGIAIIKPIPSGNLDNFKKQNGNYTVILRGRENGEVVNKSRIVSSVMKALELRGDYDEYMSLARLDPLRFVISNTTEAGIVFDSSDTFEGLPSSFPGKLTKFLYERFVTFKGALDKGLIILPVELVENNGGKLLECVNGLCDLWKLGDGFKSWVNNANIFCSTLVDRIVTGYPRGYADKIYSELGYTDELVDIGEPFGLWVIESDRDISSELPFAKCGLPVVFTDDLKPYRERKVRVLNGIHTASVLVSFLGGISIVRDMMQDADFGRFARLTAEKEIVPNVPLPEDEVKKFAESVYERFDNPFIDHELLSISLNSVSKWKTRILPSFKDFYAKNGSIPKLLTFSFAALAAFYHSSALSFDGLHAVRLDKTEYTVRDDAEVLSFFADNSKSSDEDYIGAVSRNTAFWGEDLTQYDGFYETVLKYYQSIMHDPRKAVRIVLEATE